MALAIPIASASAATGAPTLELNGPKSPGLLDKVSAVGQLPGALPGDSVTVMVQASGKTVEKKQINLGGDGKYSFPFVVNSCCNYEVTATSGGKSSGAQRFSVRMPKHIGKGPVTRLYNQSLVDEGYYLGPHVSSHFTLGARLATLAFRKVNNMARNYSYKPSIFRKLLMGQGAFKPRYHSGHHVEVDISRQVMALVNGDHVGLDVPCLHRQALDADRARDASTSTARTRATTRRGCTTPSTSSAATRRTATTRCRCTRPPATVASATRSRSRTTSTTGSISAMRSTCTSRA